MHAVGSTLQHGIMQHLFERFPPFGGKDYIFQTVYNFLRALENYKGVKIF
jgi:hypothetical protein